MKKRTADVALDAGTLLLLVSVVGLVWSMVAGHLADPVLMAGITAGIVLMGWGAFNTFTVHNDPGGRLGEALERIRQVRPS
jgi:hypothetical protein